VEGGFGNAVVGEKAIAGYFGSAASTLVAGGLGAMDVRDTNRINLSNQIFNTASIASFNNLAGTAVSSALQYAMTGSFDLNVLNLSQLTGNPAYNMGLVDLKIGKVGPEGAFGASASLGSGGTSISVGQIVQAMAGLSEAGKVMSFKLGGQSGRSTLDAINMLGYTDLGTNIALARAIKDRKINVNYDKTMASTELGQYDKSSPNLISVNAQYLGNGKLSAADIATILSHEGTHVYGNQVEGVAHVAAAETYAELAKKFGVSDATISAQILAGLSNPASWTKVDTGNVDNWSLAQNSDGGWGASGRGLKDQSRLQTASSCSCENEGVFQRPSSGVRSLKRSRRRGLKKKSQRTLPSPLLCDAPFGSGRRCAHGFRAFGPHEH
jgi:hypothetical protein